MRTGTTLKLQTTEGFEPLGAFNQPVYKSYGQIRAALLQDLGPQFADYFSRPDIDTDGKRIGWMSQLHGEPRRWVDMTPEEQAAVEAQRTSLRNGFAAYLERLRAEPVNSPRSNFAKILTQALQCPGGDYLYFVQATARPGPGTVNPLQDGTAAQHTAGEGPRLQPTVAFWGFRHADTPEGVDPLNLPIRTVGFAAPPAPPAAASPAAMAPAFAPDPVQPTGRPWWMWLLWLLGGLLLLFLLFWLLYWLFAARLGLPRLPIPLPGFELPLEQGPPGQLPAIPAGPGLPAVPGAGGTLPPPAGGAAPGLPAPGMAPPGTVPPGMAPPGEGTVPSSPPPESLAPPPGTPPTPEANQAEAGPPPDLAALPAPGAPPAPGTPLEIPPDAAPGPATFMEGQWRSRSGLRDTQGNPLEQYYRFNEKGEGEVVVRSRDGTVCRGPARAIVGQNGGLSMQEGQQLTCSNGRTLSGADTQCFRRPNGTVECQGTNAADGSSFAVEMERLGG